MHVSFVPFVCRSELATDPTLVIPAAATAALRDPLLWLDSSNTTEEVVAALDRERHQREDAETRLQDVIFQSDQLANRKLQMLHLRCEKHGVDPHGKMRECSAHSCPSSLHSIAASASRVCP